MEIKKQLETKIHQFQKEFQEFLSVIPERAQEIMGNKQFIGLAQLENTFGTIFDTENIPKIPFSEEELTHAKKLGHVLELFFDTDKDGRPMTVGYMQELVTNQTADGRKFLWDNRHATNTLFKAQTPRPGWRLTTPDIINDSTKKDYIQQTELLITYLTKNVFPNTPLPEHYQKAIAEFHAQKQELEKLATSIDDEDNEEAAKRLAALTINQIIRERYSERLQSILTAAKNFATKPLEEIYTWTNSLNSNDSLVIVGYADERRLGQAWSCAWHCWCLFFPQWVMF